MAEIAPFEPRFERCYCTGVTRAQVLAVVERHRCRTVDELRDRTGVCGGCGTCRPELDQLLTGRREPPPRSTTPPAPAGQDLHHDHPPGTIPVPQQEMDR